MDTIDRRTILATGALALTGAAATSSADAQAGPKSIFPVGTTTIPIVGETDVFPVRRIYCIGRNYAAHSREMGSDPTASRRSSSRSRPMRSRMFRSAPWPIIPILR